MWRHGDVLIERVEKIPADAKKTMSSVLAHGEVTGHSHRVETPEYADIWSHPTMLYLQVLQTVRIVHEEHGPITLEPGAYRVWRQREYTPEAIRIVRD